MAGVFHKAMVWLGLAPDDEYDDYYGDGPARAGGPQAPAGYGPQPGAPVGQQGAPMGPRGGAQRPQRPQRPMPEPDDDPFGGTGRPAPRQPGAVRQLPARGALDNDPRAPRREETPTVRPMRPTSAKPTVLAPESFDDAKDIADRFKAEQPVVIDMSGIDRDLSRRLIDFSSGICYALGGHMERVQPGSYLLVPANVEVSDEERRRLREGR